MPEKQFPIQPAFRGYSVPWSLAEEAYATYAKHYGTAQSLEKLAERHGFGGMEFAMLLAGKAEIRHPSERQEVVANLIKRLLAYRDPTAV